jgi:hypothetical protein
MSPAPSGVRSSQSARGGAPSEQWATAYRRVGQRKENSWKSVGEIVSNPENHEIATHEEVLALLSEKARDGSTSAMIALGRALRIHGGAEDKRDDELWAELYAEAPRRSPGPA